MRLRPIFRCEGCGYWQPRAGDELDSPDCPYCRRLTRPARSKSFIGEVPHGRPVSLWAAVRREPVIVP